MAANTWWTIVLIIAVSVNLPQLVKILKSRNCDGLSPLTYWLLLFVVINYAIRAILIDDWVFVTSNVLATVICVSVLTAYYRRQKGQ